MDPDVLLMEIRRMVREVEEKGADGVDFDFSEILAERIGALDEWLSRGGFAPAAWADKPEVKRHRKGR